MSRHSSPFSRPGIDQARIETAERTKSKSSDKSAAQFAATKERSEGLARERLLKARQFPPGTVVKLGRKLGVVVSIDKHGTLIVRRVSVCRIEESWTPDFVERA